MRTRNKTLLLSGLAALAIVGSLFLGIALGKTSQEPPKSSLLEKLEQSAEQQAQAQSKQTILSSPMGTISQSFFTDPIAQMQQMEAEMDRLFSGFSTPGFSSGPSLFGGGFSTAQQPSADVQETDDEFRVVISIAQGSELDLQTDLADNKLSISAQVRQQSHNNTTGRQMSSSFTSQFSRQFILDAPVDATGMQTEKSDSAVTIRIPKLS